MTGSSEAAGQMKMEPPRGNRGWGGQWAVRPLMRAAVGCRGSVEGALVKGGGGCLVGRRSSGGRSRPSLTRLLY